MDRGRRSPPAVVGRSLPPITFLRVCISSIWDFRANQDHKHTHTICGNGQTSPVRDRSFAVLSIAADCQNIFDHSHTSRHGIMTIEELLNSTKALTVEDVCNGIKSLTFEDLWNRIKAWTTNIDIAYAVVYVLFYVLFLYVVLWIASKIGGIVWFIPRKTWSVITFVALCLTTPFRPMFSFLRQITSVSDETDDSDNNNTKTQRGRRVRVIAPNEDHGSSGLAEGKPVLCKVRRAYSPSQEGKPCLFEVTKTAKQAKRMQMKKFASQSLTSTKEGRPVLFSISMSQNASSPERKTPKATTINASQKVSSTPKKIKKPSTNASTPVSNTRRSNSTPSSSARKSTAGVGTNNGTVREGMPVLFKVATTPRGNTRRNPTTPSSWGRKTTTGVGAGNGTDHLREGMPVLFKVPGAAPTRRTPRR